MYGDNGERSDLPTPGPDGHPLRDAAGRLVLVPQERPKGVSPPCQVCPKREGHPVRVPFAAADDPLGDASSWVWEVVPAVRGLMAWHQPPPDPVTELIGMAVAAHDREADRRAMLWAIAQSLKRE